MELGAGPGAISGSVVHLEHLGSEAFVHVKVDRIDLPLLARLNPDRQLPAIGSSVHLTYSANAARIFDVAGKRIDVAAPVRSGRVLEQAVG
jgi:multiple sugar transport system ATP-binding protein